MAAIFLYLNGEQKGPYLPGQVRSMLAEGAVTNDTPAWQEGLADWITLGALLATIPLSPAPPPVPASAIPQPRAPRKDQISGGIWAIIIIGVVGFLGIFVVACLAGIALGPITNGIEKARETVAVQHARVISMAMLAYAGRHQGKYPEGSTSTEVFQKLLDEHYVTTPTIFYVAMSGKVIPTGTTLTADNVCFDVTGGVTLKSSPEVPVVFSTGYSMSYGDGATATRAGTSRLVGLAVAYKGTWARFIKSGPDGTAVVSATFGMDGGQYFQLKP